MRLFRFMTAVLVTLALAWTSAQSVNNIAWPYFLPPDGHFNTYASKRIDIGIYIDLIHPPIAVYKWADAEYEGMVAESFGFAEDGSYHVTLKEGYTWSDGTPINSADLVTTFYAGYIIGWSVWDNLESVVAVDEQTAKFVMTEPSLATERLILTENLRPTSSYGDYGMQGASLKAYGAGAGNEAYDAVLKELTDFRPETFVSGGPYQILAENISDANILLVKNDGGFNADVVAFDEIVVWNGETETVFPLLQDEQLWYATHGFSPSQEEAHINKDLDIIRNPYYSGPALYVNHAVEPLNNPEFRQALAYAIDREENGFVSLGESGVAVEYMTGVSDSIISNYVDDDVLDELNTYDYDPDMAAEILEGLGYSRNDAGKWADADGNTLAFEMIFPAEFADWSAAAEHAAAALNDFGIEITARGVQFQQQVQEVYQGNFEMAIRNWGIGNPFAYQSYLQPYRRYNGQGELAGEQSGGMGFNTQVDYSGGTIDVLEKTIAASQGTDTEAIGGIITELAQSFNELLPAIPIWERFGNNPLNRNFVDAPDNEDGVYLNAGVDHFMPYMILTGMVTPVDDGLDDADGDADASDDGDDDVDDADDADASEGDSDSY